MFIGVSPLSRSEQNASDGVIDPLEFGLTVFDEELLDEDAEDDSPPSPLVIANRSKGTAMMIVSHPNLPSLVLLSPCGGSFKGGASSLIYTA